MELKNSKNIIAAITLILTIILPSNLLAKDKVRPTKLTFASYMPEVYPISKANKWFLDEVTSRTNGRIKFDVYFAQTLLKAREVFPGIGQGAADIGTSSASAYNPDLVPLSGVLLPFITDRIDVASKAFLDLYNTEPLLRQEYEKNNHKLLFALPWGENTLWGNKPVKAIQDLKGLRVRALMGIAEAFNNLGATVVGLTASESIEGLQRGTVDAVSSTPFSAAIGIGAYKFCKYATDAGRMGVYALTMTTVNLKKWNSLPKQDRAILEDVADEVADYYIKIENAYNAGGIAKVKEWGKLDMYRMPDQEVAHWKQGAAQKLWDKWVRGMEAKGIQGKKILERYRDLCEKYAPKSKYTPAFDLWQQKYGG